MFNQDNLRIDAKLVNGILKARVFYADAPVGEVYYTSDGDISGFAGPCTRHISVGGQHWNQIIAILTERFPETAWYQFISDEAVR